jgi:hypothetical protein
MHPICSVNRVPQARKTLARRAGSAPRRLCAVGCLYVRGTPASAQRPLSQFDGRWVPPRRRCRPSAGSGATLSRVEGSLACAAFFVIMTARSTRFPPQTGCIASGAGPSGMSLRQVRSCVDGAVTRGRVEVADARCCPREKALGTREQGPPTHKRPRVGARVTRPAAAIAARTGRRNPAARHSAVSATVTSDS